MWKRASAAGAAFLTLALSSAAQAGSSDAVVGAIVGAGFGAAIGHSIDGRQGALLGSAIGAVAGTAIARTTTMVANATIEIIAIPRCRIRLWHSPSMLSRLTSPCMFSPLPTIRHSLFMSSITTAIIDHRAGSMSGASGAKNGARIAMAIARVTTTAASRIVAGIDSISVSTDTDRMISICAGSH